MRFERVAALAVLLTLTTGCVTTHKGSIEPAATAGNQPRESAQEQREDAARIHTELGQRYMQRGQLKLALEKLQTALQFDAHYEPANTVIAVLYERIGKTELAERYYRAARKINPDKGGPNNNLGQFLCRQGRIDESLPYFQAAVADPFYPTPAAAYLNEGTCLMKADRAKAAEVPLRKAVALQPKRPEGLFLMASALYQQHDYFHARAFAQRLEALGPPGADALLLTYKIEMGLGEKDVAQQYAKQLRDRFPDTEQARSLNAKITP